MICGKPKRFLQSAIKRGGGKFCSKKCRDLSRITSITKNCQICEKEFTVVESKQAQRYCSQKCFSETRKGSNHPLWKGKKRSFRFITVIGHPNASSEGQVLRYRIVAEKILGRYLTKGEVIHHINGEESDDRPENLYLFENQAAHASCHNAVTFRGADKIKESNLHAATSE